MSKKFEEEVVPFLTKALSRSFSQKPDRDGVYHLDIFCDSSVKLPVGVIGRILRTPDPKAAFDDYLCDRELYYKKRHLPNIWDLYNYMDLTQAEILYEYRNEAQDWIERHVFYHYSRKRFLAQRVKANLILATPGEAKRGFRSYCRDQKEPDMDSALWEIARILNREEELLNAVKELSGHEEESAREKSVPAVIRELSEFSARRLKFVPTAARELSDFPDYCHKGALVVLADLSLETLMELESCRKRKEGVIRVCQNARMGIFDPRSGGGSDMDIWPDADVDLPVSLVWDIWPEGERTFGRDIRDEYGICAPVWGEDAVRLV